MDDKNKNNPINKKSKRKSHWVYVKIGTRIVDVKKVAISADDDGDHITHKTKLVSHTEQKRNKEIWKWASGGKSISSEQVTKSVKQTSTKFVYKSEPKVVQQRGRPTNKVKSTLHPTLPKIVRSSPTPSPPARSMVNSTKGSTLIKKNIVSNAPSSPPKSSGRFPSRNPNSLKLNPINDSNFLTNKTKKIAKGIKIKARKLDAEKNKEQRFNEGKSSTAEEKISNNEKNCEKTESIDEGFASDYSGTGKRSSIDNSSGDNSPLREEIKSTTFTSERPMHRNVRSNSLSNDAQCSTNQFHTSSHIIRLTNSFKIQTENKQNGIPTGELNKGERLFTLEMTEVVNVNLSDGIRIDESVNGKSQDSPNQTIYNVDSLIESEAKKLIEANILCALDEIRLEEKLPIILQG